MSIPSIDSSKLKDNYYCAENLMCPTTSCDACYFIYRIRYIFIRCLTCSVPCIPSSFPVLGGKSLIEVILTVLGFIIGIIICAASGPIDVYLNPLYFEHVLRPLNLHSHSLNFMRLLTQQNHK